jgi:hypothetical protein
VIALCAKTGQPAVLGKTCRHRRPQADDAYINAAKCNFLNVRQFTGLPSFSVAPANGGTRIVIPAGDDLSSLVLPIAAAA